MRDILNYYNFRRDYTMTAKEFTNCLVNELKLKDISDVALALLVDRYKASHDRVRVVFTKFLHDLELIEAGISPALVWATGIAEDILKALVVKKNNDIMRFFKVYTK